MRDLLHARAGGGGAHTVHSEDALLLRRIYRPVHIHDAGGRLENVLHLPRRLDARRVIGGIHLCDERRQHRRPRRNLGDLRRGVVAARDRVDARTHRDRDGVALSRAVALPHQVHLHIRHVWPAASEVVAHQSVEVERRRGARVHLRALHLGHTSQINRDLLAQRIRRFERRAFGKIEHHLKLALVVERQHLHLHRLHEHEPHREEQHREHAAVEHAPRGATIHERHHDARIEPAHARFLLGFVRWVVRRGYRMHVPLEQPVGEVGRDDEGHRQRRHHRDRRAHRDGAHVRAHHAGDECHRQYRGDDGEGGEDRGISHLVDGIHRRHLRRPVAHLEVAIDVLHHDDRVVHQNADGKDECEERDAIERVAERVVHEQRERERDRHRYQHHRRLAPSQEEPDQQRHRDRGDEEVQNQLPSLVAGGLAVVARDVESHVGWEESPLRRGNPFQHRVRHRRGVGALPLRHRDRHGTLGRPRASLVRHVARRFPESFGDIGDVAQGDRRAVVHAHHHGPDLFDRGERRPDIDLVDLIGGSELTRLQPRVRAF